MVKRRKVNSILKPSAPPPPPHNWSSSLYSSHEAKKSITYYPFPWMACLSVARLSPQYFIRLPWQFASTWSREERWKLVICSNSIFPKWPSSYLTLLIRLCPITQHFPMNNPRHNPTWLKISLHSLECFIANHVSMQF